MILAIKYNEDKYYDNAYYASVGGIALGELNFLEGEMLGMIRFDLFVYPELYEKYLGEIKVNSTAGDAVESEGDEVAVEDSKDEPMSSCEATKPGASQGPTMGSIKTLPSNAEMNEAADAV